MYHDEKREKKWTKQQEQILEQERQLKEIDKQGGITLREIQKIHDEFEPRLPPPFYETTARAKYLEGLDRQYSSITLPIAPAKGFSLQAIFQPLKLRRDPLAAEDLAREERRALLQRCDKVLSHVIE